MITDFFTIAKGYPRMLFIHEIGVIFPLYLFPRISENLAEGIEEVDKIAVVIYFVNSVTYLL